MLASKPKISAQARRIGRCSDVRQPICSCECGYRNSTRIYGCLQVWVESIAILNKIIVFIVPDIGNIVVIIIAIAIVIVIVIAIAIDIDIAIAIDIAKN